MIPDINNPINISSLPMLEIPQGKIELRDDRTKQKWTVEIVSFLLAQFPVTQAEYFAVTNESPSVFKGNKLPVETVSWKDAITFCNLLSAKAGLKPCYSINSAKDIVFDAKASGFRLPTEAEWEYACKAGTTGIRYGELDSIAWYKGNSEKATHDILLKAPQCTGLYDMLAMFGNGVLTFMIKLFMALTASSEEAAGAMRNETVWLPNADAAIPLHSN